MKKLIAIAFSDLHIMYPIKNHSRLDTSFKVLSKISKICKKNKVPALHCGDLFHRPEFIEIELLDRVLKEFDKLDKREFSVYSISGNHCIATKSTINKSPLSWDSIFSRKYKWLNTIDFEKISLTKDIDVYGVPYIDNNVGLMDYLDNLEFTSKKNILLIHTDLPGAADTDNRKVDSHENINLNVLGKFDLVLSGHIHKPQRLGKKIYMVGAPYQQRRTDRNCKLGYWEVYSDLTLKFVELKGFPRYIDVSSKEEVQDDGNYYKVISETDRVIEKRASNPNPISNKMSKKKIIRKYFKHRGIDQDAGKKRKIKISIHKSETDD